MAARRISGGYKVKVPIKAGVTITPATIACYSAGFLTTGDDTAGLISIGVADEAVDNKNGGDGDLSAWVWINCIAMVDLDPSIVAADAGHAVYILNSTTVAKASATTNATVGGVMLWANISDAYGLLRF